MQRSTLQNTEDTLSFHYFTKNRGNFNFYELTYYIHNIIKICQHKQEPLLTAETERGCQRNMETIWHVIDVIQSYTLKISQGGLGNRGLNSKLNSITSLRQVVA